MAYDDVSEKNITSLFGIEKWGFLPQKFRQQFFPKFCYPFTKSQTNFFLSTLMCLRLSYNKILSSGTCSRPQVPPWTYDTYVR